MTQDALITVASDALCGLLRTAMPAGIAVMLAPPSSIDAPDRVAVHLLRIATPAVARSAPMIGMDGRRIRTTVNLQLDYLIDARAADPLQAQTCLGTALRALGETAVLGEDTVAPLLSQSDRLASLLPATISLQLKTLELAQAEQSALWHALGAPPRGALFWRMEVAWQAVDGANGGPVLQAPR